MFNINDVSRMLREARIQKNLTQNALADQMGVTYQAVSNWERGTSVPDISNLARLCEILELLTEPGADRRAAGESGQAGQRAR